MIYRLDDWLTSSADWQFSFLHLNRIQSVDASQAELRCIESVLFGIQDILVTSACMWLPQLRLSRAQDQPNSLVAMLQMTLSHVNATSNYGDIGLPFS